MYLRVLLLATALVLSASAARADALEDASAAVRTAWEKHKSMAAKVSVMATPSVGSARIGLKGEGKSQALRIDNLERYKSNLRITFTEPMTAVMQVETLFDGKEIQLTNDTLGQKLSRKGGEGIVEGAVPPGGAPLLDALARNAKVELAPDTKVGDIDAYVFDAHIAKGDAGPGPVARVRAAVAKDTGALLKIEIFETEDVVTATIEQKDFEWDLEIDPSAFDPSKAAEVAVPIPRPPAEPAKPAASGAPKKKKA